MTEERSIDIYDLDELARDAAAAAEVRGARTRLLREGRPAAIILSWDEYLSLAETIAISSDRALLHAIEEGDAQLQRGSAGTVDDLPGSSAFASAALDVFTKLDESLQSEARTALSEIGGHAIAGAPLYDPLRGLWSWRGEKIRIVYRIAPQGNAIGIVAIARLAGETH